MTPQAQVRTAAEGNMPVWGPLEIKLIRPLKCGFIAVGGGDPHGHGVTSRDLLPAYFSVVASAPHKMIYRRRPEQSLLNCCLQRHNVRPAALAAILLSQGYKGRANSVRRRDHRAQQQAEAVRHKLLISHSAPAYLDRKKMTDEIVAQLALSAVNTAGEVIDDFIMSGDGVRYGGARNFISRVIRCQ